MSEAGVGLTVVSDRHKKENFRAVDAEDVLKKVGQLDVPSWNYAGHDSSRFRHYGPMAQDFFAAFGHDGVGTIGTPTTITSGDIDGILMSAMKTVEKRTADLQQEPRRSKPRSAESVEGRSPSTHTVKRGSGCHRRSRAHRVMSSTSSHPWARRAVCCTLLRSYTKDDS
jgi:hypothetical protein